MIDSFTLFATAAVLVTKDPDEIVKILFSHWINIFGVPKEFITSNNGQFMSQELEALCDGFNILIKEKESKDYWFKEIYNRHNLELEQEINRILQNDC